MNGDSPALAWAGYVALLAFVAIGGGFSSLVPELHRYAVEAHRWVTSEQFVASFALAQAAPGPNVIFVTLLGWQIGGWKGAALSAIGVMLPALTVTLAVVRYGRPREQGSRLAVALHDGLLPLGTGMLASTAWVVFDGAGHDWRGAAVALATLAILARYRVNQVWLIAAAALAGAAGWV